MPFFPNRAVVRMEISSCVAPGQHDRQLDRRGTKPNQKRCELSRVAGTPRRRSKLPILVRCGASGLHICRAKIATAAARLSWRNPGFPQNRLAPLVCINFNNEGLGRMVMGKPGKSTLLSEAEKR